MSTDAIAAVRLCPECRFRPQPAPDNPVCPECEAKIAERTARGFTPRKCRPTCVVCGAPEGDPHVEYVHRVHDERQAEERAKEARIAELVAAKLAPAPAAPTPADDTRSEQVWGDADDAALILGTSTDVVYQRKARGQLPLGSFRQTAGRHIEFHLPTLRRAPR